MTVPAGQSAGDGFAQRGGYSLADIGRTPHAANSRRGHDFVFFFRRARAAADDGAGMTHAASGRRSLSGDEANHRLAHASPNEFRGLLLGIAADLADHDDGMRIGIIVEEAHGIQKRCADDGIAANANAGGLSYAQVHELADGFVGQRAAAADHSNVAHAVNLSGHDADFALTGRDDAGAVGADEASLAAAKCSGHAHHIQRGNTFGDADDERQPGVNGLEHGVSGKGRRHENGCGIGVRLARRFGDGVEDGHIVVQRAALARGDAGDHARAVSDHLPRMEAAFAAREALHEHTSQFVYQNAHRAPLARRTAFSAPSFMFSPIVKLSPESRRICRPCSTLVPSMRTTTGSFICSSRAAATTPVASTSQRRMPPKMLMKTPRTSLSLMRILKAFFTWSAEAPPPTSRKFAGAPPASLMMSMVAMARPAPLTMQPTVPSSLM